MLEPLRMAVPGSAVYLALVAGTLAAQPPPVVFMELSGESSSGAVSLFRQVQDSARVSEYQLWLENEAARWATDLYTMALDISAGSPPNLQPPELHIALVPGGNQAEVGFGLVGASDTTLFPHASYVVLAPQQWRFGITLLHEVGHVVLNMFRRGVPLPRRKLASITHTTAALTDRTTAFTEGFATSLETLLVHLSDEEDMKNKYRHEQMLFGTWPGLLSEYYRQSRDLITFAQSVGRYEGVRDNRFAFTTAVTAPDYLRVQLEHARDYSRLRNPNQLLQSEGFYATFFFAFIGRGLGRPSIPVVKARLREVLEALSLVLASDGLTSETPYLLDVVDALGRTPSTSPSEALDVLLDLSHGAFMDPRASDVWRRHYLAALHLDLNGTGRVGIEELRQEWRERALNDPETLARLLGPQIRCVVPSVTIELDALGMSDPLSFDANTVQDPILRLVPGMAGPIAERWLVARNRQPFINQVDLWNRIDVPEAVMRQIDCGSADSFKEPPLHDRDPGSSFQRIGRRASQTSRRRRR